MRFPMFLVLTALVAVAGCGDDSEPPEDTAIPPSAAQQRRMSADTTLGDTTTAGQQAQRPGGQQAQRPGGQAGGQAGGQQTAGGQTSGGRTGGAAAPSGSRLYTVQVAAFESADSARKWMGRLRSLDLPVWTSMSELGGTTYYRVRVGAVSSVADARRLGGMLSDRFEWPVWVAPITPADQMPEDAAAATRRILGGG